MALLKLDKLIIYKSEIGFDTDGVQNSAGFEVSEPKAFFDNEAIKLLNENNVNRVQISVCDGVSVERIVQIHELLSSSGIVYN